MSNIFELVKNNQGLHTISLFEKMIGRTADLSNARESGSDEELFRDFNRELTKAVAKKQIKAVNIGFNSYKYY